MSEEQITRIVSMIGGLTKIVNDLSDTTNKRFDSVDKRLDQLILEQFNTRMEVTVLAQRVAALEGKKPNGHALQGV